MCPAHGRDEVTQVLAALGVCVCVCNVQREGGREAGSHVRWWRNPQGDWLVSQVAVSKGVQVGVEGTCVWRQHLWGPSSYNASLKKKKKTA